MSRRRPPPHLPILDRRLRGEVPRVYEERELDGPVSLCRADGRLEPEARGWSRRPLVRANLRRGWPRRKRWNFWSWISPECVFSVTVADLDFASFASFFLVDFASGERVEGMDLRPPGFVALPETVEADVVWRSRRLECALRWQPDPSLALRGRGRRGEAVEAEIRSRRPPGHESLNVVVPWTERRFQLNSKWNALPSEGLVRVGERRFALRAETCHAVQDWGRGLWPHRACWNWAVCTGPTEAGLLGVNLGDRWTTGTGASENGICWRGRLHKLSEDVAWSYDPGDWHAPWRLRTLHSDAVDLVLTPVYVHTSSLDLGLLATGGTCAFGRFRGVVRVEGRALDVPDLLGWAEEFSHRW